MVNPNTGSPLNVHAVTGILIDSARPFHDNVSDNDIIALDIQDSIVFVRRTGISLRKDRSLVAINRDVRTHFNSILGRNGISSRLHVDRVTASFCILAQVADIAHGDRGFTRTSRGASILSCPSRHRKIRRGDRKGSCCKECTCENQLRCSHNSTLSTF